MSILYIDDDSDRLKQVKELIGNFYDLEVVFNGWEGVGAALMYKPQLVLMNLRSPVMNGLEALRLIRSEERLKNLPVIGFTVPEDDEVNRLAIKAGCNTIISSPLLGDLDTIIKQHLPQSD